MNVEILQEGAKGHEESQEGDEGCNGILKFHSKKERGIETGRENGCGSFFLLVKGDANREQVKKRD
jgi:hypothetical protein